MMKKYSLILPMIVLGVAAGYAQSDYEDDIYYNPKKDKTASVVKQERQNNYIADFQGMDVDTYNRRGQYYLSPIDTIGAGAENGEDFVYTQQIQKYYNPTIVIDNAELLADVLNNSYGNVNIEITDDGIPYFGPYNSWYMASPYYSTYWGPSWTWNWGFGNWGFGIGWGWSNPWYWDAWGPAWAWGPSYGWTWGPGGYWYPGWGWGGWRPDPAWTAHHYRPGGNRPVGAGGNWAHNTRPTYNGNGVHHNSAANVNSSSSYYPGGNHRTGGVSSYNTGAYGNHRANGTIGTINRGTGYGNTRVGGTGNSRVGGSSYNRGTTYNSGTTNRGNSVGNTRSNSSTTRTYNYNSGSSSNRGSYNSGGNHRSGGSGSFGGGHSGGGRVGGGGGRR